MEDEMIIIENPNIDISANLGDADIFMWQFHNAPQELKDLSVNGGDEDWLVIVKSDIYNNNYIPFLEEHTAGGIGVCSIDYFQIGSYIMAIGSHA